MLLVVLVVLVLVVLVVVVVLGGCDVYWFLCFYKWC